MNSNQKTARIAGFIYLIFAALSAYFYLGFPSLIVSGNATATANNIAASEPLFRISILGGLITLVLFIFLVLVLYRLFNGVDHIQASLMVALVLAGVTASFVNTLNRITVLEILSGDGFLSVFNKPQLDALAYLFIRIHSNGTQVIQMFWGLWLFPFGILVIKSRFIPGILGVLLMFAGVAYVLNSLTFVFLPQYVGIVSKLTMPLEFGELPIIIWLLIKGVKAKQPAMKGAA